jgi:Xaa-Pro dipeptidase
MFSRRDFLKNSGLLFGLANSPTYFMSSQEPSFELIKFKSISDDERIARVRKAQQLMLTKQLSALILDAGTSMEYFTGLRWYPSERSLLAIIPSNGDLFYICPAFEEDRLNELPKLKGDVITWDEHENPFELALKQFKMRNMKPGKVGIEDKARFFIAEGLRSSTKNYQFVLGNDIIIPCRSIKSDHEIELMQLASDATIKAIQYAIQFLEEGTTAAKIVEKIAYAHQKMGAQHDFADVNFGIASSFPHGSSKRGPLKKGDTVMMDVGCRIGGYCSDITRTFVFGPASDYQKQIWELEQKAQLAGFGAAKLGVACEEVDKAARKVITDAGFGPGYKLPGVPHRTGHGIGMNGHEWPYMVKNNKTLLEPGMCFSIEPTIAIPGKFGIRLEDCVYMTSQGPKWFTQPASSLLVI